MNISAKVYMVMVLQFCLSIPLKVERPEKADTVEEAHWIWSSRDLADLSDYEWFQSGYRML